jgi:RecA/RadA recombinase
MSGTIDQANILGQAFEKVITKKFGSKRSPEPLIFSTGIKHLDALLGGGIVSSGPVMITSTPETGKSTFAYQMAKQLHDNYENSITVYIDIEGSGGTTKSNEFRVSRMDTFGLQDSHRFSYQPIVLDILELFELIESLIETKILVEKKTGKEFLLFIIWDSIPSTRTSKTSEAISPDKIIGLKGRQLSFVLDKYLPMLKFNRVFFLGIDQVRADIKIDQFAANEQTVGNFKNLKAATNIFSLQHY